MGLLCNFVHKILLHTFCLGLCLQERPQNGPKTKRASERSLTEGPPKGAPDDPWSHDNTLQVTKAAIFQTLSPSSSVGGFAFKREAQVYNSVGEASLPWDKHPQQI